MNAVRLPFLPANNALTSPADMRGGVDAEAMRQVMGAADRKIEEQTAAALDLRNAQAVVELRATQDAQRAQDEERMALELHAAATLERARGNRNFGVGAALGVFFAFVVGPKLAALSAKG